jgi:metal-responsive CopG/Arc/MetJ family transcriptional regulator
MTHQPVSMPPDMYDELKEALKGTRFEGNRSAAIRDCIQSLIDERKKMKH